MNFLTRTLVLAFSLMMGSQAFAARTTTFFHGDGLGSVVAATNEAGQVLWRKDYAPFGEQIDTTPDTERTSYTGKQHDDVVGLTYFGARWFDPEIGRFTSVDPVSFVDQHPMSFNRYSYVLNNPYKYVDPDGRWWFLAAVVVGLVASDTANTPIPGEVAEPEGGAARFALGTWSGMAARGAVMRQPARQEVVEREITLSRKAHGEAAEHAADAIKAGRPDVLTINRPGAPGNRQASTGGLDKVPGKHLDEYPPAMFKEGGAGASVRAINPRDNLSAGACIGNSCRGLPDGARVRIKVED